MSGRKIIEGLEEAVAMARAMPPTDAEVEAMAERLWNAWGVHVLSVGLDAWPKAWAETAAATVLNEQQSGHFKEGFRAMARAALEKRDEA